jgi:hypothetical protein
MIGVTSVITSVGFYFAFCRVTECNREWVLKNSVIGVSFFYEYHRYQVFLRSILVKSWLAQGVLSC